MAGSLFQISGTLTLKKFLLISVLEKEDSRFAGSAFNLVLLFWFICLNQVDESTLSNPCRILYDSSFSS